MEREGVEGQLWESTFTDLPLLPPPLRENSERVRGLEGAIEAK